MPLREPLPPQHAAPVPTPVPQALAAQHRQLLALCQAAFLAVLPDGGQGGARSNAWAGRSREAVRLRAWREAEAAWSAAPTVPRRAG